MKKLIRVYIGSNALGKRFAWINPDAISFLYPDPNIESTTVYFMSDVEDGFGRILCVYERMDTLAKRINDAVR